MVFNSTLLEGKNLNYIANDSYILLYGLEDQPIYASVLASVKYNSSADEPPMPGTRVITFTVQEDAFITASTATVTIKYVNDPPAVVPLVGVTFNESTRTPVSLFDSAAFIDDSDDDVLQWVTIELTQQSLDAMDNLTISTTNGVTIERVPTSEGSSVCLPAENELTYQYINVMGPANKSVFVSALRSLTFSNDCPGLDTGDRMVSVTLADDDDENVQIVYVSIEAVDEPPSCYFGPWPVSQKLKYFAFST